MVDEEPLRSGSPSVHRTKSRSQSTILSSSNRQDACPKLAEALSRRQQLIDKTCLVSSFSAGPRVPKRAAIAFRSKWAVIQSGQDVTGKEVGLGRVRVTR